MFYKSFLKLNKTEIKMVLNERLIRILFFFVFDNCNFISFE